MTKTQGYEIGWPWVIAAIAVYLIGVLLLLRVYFNGKNSSDYLGDELLMIALITYAWPIMIPALLFTFAVDRWVWPVLRWMIGLRHD